jgi:hypothetical protein
MRRFRGERGEGQLGCIIGLIIFLGVVFVAWKMIPVKVRTSELRGEVIDLSRAAGPRTDAQIRQGILFKAEQLDLPVTANDITVRRLPGSVIRVEVEYVVPVEFPGYTHQWKQRHTAENPIF